MPSRQVQRFVQRATAGATVTEIETLPSFSTDCIYNHLMLHLNVSREGLILFGMERTAACCVSLLSALFANVRICRLVASFGVSHQRIFHFECCIRLHLGPALLTYSGGRLSPDCISFFLQGQHWQVYSFVPAEQKHWTPLCYYYQCLIPISHVSLVDCVLQLTSRQESHFSHEKLPRIR